MYVDIYRFSAISPTLAGAVRSLLFKAALDTALTLPAITHVGVPPEALASLRFTRLAIALTSFATRRREPRRTHRTVMRGKLAAAPRHRGTVIAPAA